MIQFGWIEYDLVAFAFQSTHNLWLLDLLNYAAISGIVYSRIWRNLHSDIEIDRNKRSEELLKLGAVKKFSFSDKACPMRGRSENFHFQGGLPYEGEGGIDFLEGDSYHSASYYIWFS